jgi:hypothetical protein
MSEPLFDFVETAPDRPAPERATERTMLDLLAQRYTRISMNAHRYAFAEHVADRTSWAGRIADFVAVDCYQGNEIHGHEVKVSRSDWLAELRDPDKAEAWRPYVHRWWLVVADRSIVRDGELPDGWGLLVRQGARLAAAVRAPKLTPQPMPPSMIAALLRATAKTAARSGGSR